VPRRPPPPPCTLLARAALASHPSARRWAGTHARPRGGPPTAGRVAPGDARPACSTPAHVFGEPRLPLAGERSVRPLPAPRDELAGARWPLCIRSCPLAPSPPPAPGASAALTLAQRFHWLCCVALPAVSQATLRRALGTRHLQWIAAGPVHLLARRLPATGRYRGSEGYLRSWPAPPPPTRPRRLARGCRRRVRRRSRAARTSTPGHPSKLGVERSSGQSSPHSHRDTAFEARSHLNTCAAARWAATQPHLTGGSPNL
jgi:hypothetical protein